MHLFTEPLKGHSGGKNFGVSGKNLGCKYKMSKIMPAFTRKTFVFSRKYVCVLSQNQLSSDKLFLFTLQLAAVTDPHVHNGAVHRVFF